MSTTSMNCALEDGLGELWMSGTSMPLPRIIPASVRAYSPVAHS
jgi:hypothetical protein